MLLEKFRSGDRPTLLEHLSLPCVQSAFPEFSRYAPEVWAASILSSLYTYRITVEGQMIGGARLERLPHCDFSYWIHPDFRRQGFATQANRLLCERATKLGWPDISGTCRADNIASQTILSREGFQRLSETLWTKQLS